MLGKKEERKKKIDPKERKGREKNKQFNSFATDAHARGRVLQTAHVQEQQRAHARLADVITATTITAGFEGGE